MEHVLIQTCASRDRLTWWICLSCVMPVFHRLLKRYPKGLFWLLLFFSGCFLILCRCYTKKTSGKGFQFPSLQRWRESNTIKKTLVWYLKKQTKNPLTNLKSFFKKINGYILKPNQLMPVKTLTCLVYNLMLTFPVKSVSPFWLNINIT